MIELNTNTLQKAALKAGISEKTARKYRKQALSDKKLETFPRINPNPFEAHWPEVVEMLERAPEIQALTIITYLAEKYPQIYKINQKRSMQRRVKAWRAENGSNKPVIFRQNLVPGRQSQSDWTHMSDLKITINGQKFDHLLFHFILPYSGFETVMICQSESFETLTRGFEQAVLQLGGVAYEHRTDNLTAATQKMGNDRVFTQRWMEFLKHYGVQPSRNNPGVSHENGSIEKSHHILKTAIAQHLILRQSHDFKSLEDYQYFINKIKNKRNFARLEKIAEEIKTLRYPPDKQFNEAVILSVRVSPSSTIQILGITYSVPSRLIGTWLKAIVLRYEINLMYGNKKLLSLPRLEAGALIDYRHIIDSLLRKPGAFESYQYRSYLYPNISFRKAYDALQSSALTSCNKRYLELLHLAKMYGEEQISLIIDLLLEATELPIKTTILLTLEEKRSSTARAVKVAQPNLQDYDQLHQFREIA